MEEPQVLSELEVVLEDLPSQSVELQFYPLDLETEAVFNGLRRVLDRF